MEILAGSFDRCNISYNDMAAWLSYLQIYNRPFLQSTEKTSHTSTREDLVGLNIGSTYLFQACTSSYILDCNIDVYAMSQQQGVYLVSQMDA